jgi:prolipoprotein diacylglyceryltransferase
MPLIHLAFELLAWLLAAIAGYGVYRWRLQRVLQEAAGSIGPGYFLALAAGSVTGAYLFGTLNLYLSAQPALGRSILGGLVSAIAAVEIYKRHRGVRGSTGAVFAVPFCVTLVVGRLGCFGAGLSDFTYGVVTTVFWGVDFGDGQHRHPVQLYESAAMLLGLAVLLYGLGRRSTFVLANAFYLTVGWYALQRFVWEFFKPYGTVLGPLNLFHLLCLVLAAYAAFMLALPGSAVRSRIAQW